jgi:hypothetical protein
VPFPHDLFIDLVSFPFVQHHVDKPTRSRGLDEGTTQSTLWLSDRRLTIMVTTPEAVA